LLSDALVLVGGLPTAFEAAVALVERDAKTKIRIEANLP
jgi:hypothetical protein